MTGDGSTLTGRGSGDGIGGRALMGVVVMAAVGAGAALGVWLMLLGARGHRVLPNRRRVVGAGVATSAALGWGLAAVAAGLVGLAITGWPVVAVSVGGAVLAGPRLLAGQGERTRDTARTQAVATWTEMIRDNIAGAAGLEQALATTVGLAPAAIRPELRVFAARLETKPLTDGLAMLGDDLNNPAADLVIAALANAVRMESRDLGSLLSRLADSIRADVRMRERVEVGRARIRTSARMVIGVTVATVAFLFVFSRELLAVYDGVTGQLFLLVVLGTFAAGGWLLRVYATVEMPERFSARQGPARASRGRS